MDYTGKVVLVTGGTRGVGRGITERFALVGATVVTCARRQPDQPFEEKVDLVLADIRDPGVVSDLVASTAERHGRLDVLVNNAGGSPPAESATASPRFSEAIVLLNLLAPLWISQAANAVMQTQEEGGSIVNVASVSGLRASPNTAAYGAAKAGLLNLTETLAVEWAPRVRVNAVTPGYIRTEKAPLFYGDEDGMARVAGVVAMGRLGSPRDIAEACLWLASPAAGYVSGANIIVHGGGESPSYISASEGIEESRA